MVFLTIIAAALTFTIASHAFKKGFMAFASVGFWIIASIYCFSISEANWDTNFCLGFLFIFLTLIETFSPLAWRETAIGNEKPEEPDVADLRKEMETFNRERSQYAFLHSKRHPRRRTRW